MAFKKRPSRFPKGLLIYALILLFLVAAVLTVLALKMAQFQKSYDAEQAALAAAEAEAAAQAAQLKAEYRAPQEAFESWYASQSAEDWTVRWKTVYPDAPEAEAQINAEMSRLFFSEETACYKADDFSQTAPVYEICNGDESLARVSLSGNGTEWTISDVSFTLIPQQNGSITVLSDSVPLCNGFELDESNVSETKSYFACNDPSGEGLDEKLVNPIQWTTYTVSDLLSEPQLTSSLPDGSFKEVLSDGTLLLTADSADYNEYCENSVDFVRTYLYYFMRGKDNSASNLNRVLSYLKSGTTFYNTLYSTYYIVSYNQIYENVETDDTRSSRVVIWADNCFSIDVDYSCYGVLWGTRCCYASGTIRVFYLDEGTGYYIAAIEQW